MRRYLTIGIACVPLGLAGFVASSAFDTHGSVAAPNQTTEGTTTTETTVPAATTTAPEPATPTPAAAETDTSGTNWLLIAIEGLIVVGFIALGVRSGGIGLGLWGGVGTLILVFFFGLDPGEPPFDAMLIIVAVISAAAAMQAAGGIDYMVQIASKALRARDRARSTSSRRTCRTCSAYSPGRATPSSRSSP